MNLQYKNKFNYEGVVMKLLLAVLVFIAFTNSALFADAHGKKEKEYKSNEKAYEMANEKAKFKREEGWKKDKDDDSLEDKKDKGEKKAKKSKKEKKSKKGKK